MVEEAAILCVGASNDIKDNQVELEFEWNLQFFTKECQQWRVLECRWNCRKEKRVKKIERGVEGGGKSEREGRREASGAGQSRATKFILSTGSRATFLGQSHTLLQIHLHKSPGQGTGIYLEISLYLRKSDFCHQLFLTQL